MSDGRTCLADEHDLAAFGSHTVRIAESLREQVSRNRATAQALREYLDARAGAGGQHPVLLTEPTPTSVRDARAYVRRRCDEQHVSADRRDVLELAVSELVGNALRHGRPPVSYDVTPDGDDLVLVVDDADTTAPGDAVDCGPECEGGRGLFLISRLARSWGWEPSAAGKRVWVRA